MINELKHINIDEFIKSINEFNIGDYMNSNEFNITENVPKEEVNHPDHYSGGIECIDAMRQCFGDKTVQDFCLCNAFKYLWRCFKKHSKPLTDINKVQWYLAKYLTIESENNES